MFQKAMKCFGHEAKFPDMSLSQTVDENQMDEAIIVHIVAYAPPNPQHTSIGYEEHMAFQHDLITAVVSSAIERSYERERYQRTLFQARQYGDFPSISGSSMADVFTQD
ncbi:hypothetical protein NEOLI_004174 [Neolecta irregularis DAH-3]|uniref:Uncharacterized protein n=1 Tax=Neolecta irregularis (strain DAH-3) TaxID=1198029 RepID=A0A1U7LM33_NEOID|nr:hypothetical protein NEOLI_004174 [Neolecta irregularis DAH-3]|eukprot:OLL23643.1 hypothetical protein NEOLI_004174 [Neolecta irregularis DAH-3]